MGRNLRSTVPQTSVHVVPQWDYLEEFREQEHEYKRKQQREYNQHYPTSKLPVIPEDMPVWVRSGKQPSQGKVVTQASTPRSYPVVTPTPSDVIRRNRSHLQVIPQPVPDEPEPDLTGECKTESGRDAMPDRSEVVVPQRIATRSQTGTTVRPPDRYM